MDSIEKRPQANALGQHMGKLPQLIAAGEHTMASADEDITIVGLKATDIVVVGLHTQDGSADITDLVGVCEADNLNIKCTLAGSGTGVASYIVVRPAAA